MDDSRKRTIKYILNCLQSRGLLKKRIPHECDYKSCSPKNIFSFMSVAQCSHFSYDSSVWVCLKQKIHICSNSTCAFSYTNNLGNLFCPLTGKSHTRYISDIEIQNKKDRIPSKRYCSIPQDNWILDTHRHTLKMKTKALNNDKFYNQTFFKTVTENNNNMVLDRNISVKFIKRRERKIKERKINKGETPSNIQILDIFRIRKPLLPQKVFLYSYKLFNYVMKDLTVLDFLLSTEDVKISTHIKSLKTSKYTSLIASAEYILPRILPGIYRIKRDWPLIETLQTKAHSDNLTYIKKCLAKKILTNKMEEVLNFLDFDKKWKDRHLLTNWVTFEKWEYFLKVILRSYIFCEHCGEINQDKRSLGLVKHILGVMYTLKSGYIKTVGPATFKLIPQDNYLKKYGVLLVKNKLSKYVEGDARKWVNEGEKTFHEFLDKGFEVMTAVEIRNIIFP